MNNSKFVKCPGCGALVMVINGPVHRYIGAVAGCWNIYCKVLAREYGNNGFPEINRLLVDAYAVQHPGNESELTAQSVAVHLLGLYYSLEKGFSKGEALNLVRKFHSGNKNLHWLNPPASPGKLTISDVYKAKSSDDYVELVKTWAKGVWDSWNEHHDIIKSWALLAEK